MMMMIYNLKTRQLAVVLTILSFFNILSNSIALAPDHIIRVCQNKDCRKRFSPRAPDGSLVQTVQDLLPADGDDSPKISIESSGCLSQCGKGPNVCVENCNTGKERLFFGVDSASSAAAILDVACDYDPEINIILAADKISKAQIGRLPCYHLLFLFLCDRKHLIESPTRPYAMPRIGATCFQQRC